MDAITNLSPMRRIVSLLLTIAGLVGLYYLYQYLFGSTMGNSYMLVSKNQTANPVTPVIIGSDKLPAIYEGGEFTVSTWIYVNDWNYHRGNNKSILSIEGNNFDIIRIYLGSYKPSLSVRLQTKENGVSNTNVMGDTQSSGSRFGGALSQATESLEKNTRESTFNTLQTESGLLDGSPICDLPEIELQRWVCITVAVNGKTVDVYYDGKLARSCVLPTFYKVDAGGYSAKLLGYGGFGGQISRTIMYDVALNPEQVYKIYMAGPEPITSVGEWFASFFAPGVNIAVTQTK
jgi:hypothetical protein